MLTPPRLRSLHVSDARFALFNIKRDIPFELGRFPYLEKLFADSAYQGPIFAEAVAKILSRVKVEIVKRSDQAKGFVTLPKRWIVERTLAWISHNRRLARDFERYARSVAALVRLAMIRLMLRRLTRPYYSVSS